MILMKLAAIACFAAASFFAIVLGIIGKHGPTDQKNGSGLIFLIFFAVGTLILVAA